VTIKVDTLSNGLRVATDAVSSVESVSLGIWVGVGTRNEPAAFNGIAHFLEHMAFKGTNRRSALEIAREIEAVGGHLNAYTSRENTAFYAKVLKEDTGLALDILADILQNSLFEEQELARERSVILQEIGQSHDTPDDIVFDHFQVMAYRDQAFGKPVLGTPDTVKAIDRDAIVGYLSRHYAADRLVVAASGNLDHDWFCGEAERLLGGLATSGSVDDGVATYTGGEYREERDLEQVHLVMGFPSVGLHHDDLHASSVLSTLLGGGMSSRLFQEIREKRGLVYSIYSFASSYADCGVLGIYAGTGEQEVAELVPVLCDELAILGTSLQDQEVADARAQLKAATLMALESTSARVEQLAQQLLVYGRPIPIAEQVAKIEAVDTAAAARVAGDIFSGKPTVAAIGPLGHLEDYGSVIARLAA